MAEGVRIPRVMTVIPQVAGLSTYKSDLNSMTAATKNAASQIQSAFNRVNSATTGGASVGVSNLSRSFSSAATTITSSISTIISGVGNMGNSIAGVGRRIEGIGLSMRRLAFDMERVGRTLTVALTLPIVGAGLAMIKAGGEFEAALVKVQTLVGVNRDVVQAWGKEILRVAPLLSTLPTEMAEGLFAAASAFGNVAAQAPVMEVLTAATQGAVIGLGEIQEVGRSITGVMKAYGEENINAETSLALLIKTAQQGNFELDTLTTTLGRVLGIAAQAGVGAGELLATISTLTLTSTTASQAVTSISAAITSMIKPTQAAKDILEAYGISAEELSDKLGDQGLQKTLFELKDTISDADFLQLFTRRGLRGVLLLTGELRDDYKRILDSMVFDTEVAFDKMNQAGIEGAGEMGRDWRDASQEVKSAFEVINEAVVASLDTIPKKVDGVKASIQSLGITIFQVFEQDIKNALDRVFLFTQNLTKLASENQETVKLIAKFAGALALLGPSLIIAGRLTGIFSLMFQVVGRGIIIFGTFIQAILNTVGLFVRLGAAIAGPVISGFSLLAQGAFVASRAVLNLVVSLGTLIGQQVLAGLTAGIDLLISAFGRLVIGAQAAAAIMGRIAFGAVGTVVSTLVGAVLSLASGFVSLVGFIGPVIGALAGIASTAGAAAVALGVVAAAALALVGAISDAWTGITEFISGIVSQIKGFFGDALADVQGDARSWGEGLMAAYANGITDGLIYVIDSLAAVGRAIAYWLQSFSPPRLLPDIDKWGQGAMQAYLDGWAKADFSVLFDIGDTIKRYLTAITESTDTRDKSIAESVLGSRRVLIDAINQIREFGTVSEDQFKKIFDAIGLVTPELEGYIKATLQLAVANQRLAVAQNKVNEINKRYADLLQPIADRLSEIEKIRQGIADAGRIEELQNVLQDRYASDITKSLARLEIEEIGLKGRQASLEAGKSEELLAAEKQVSLAQEQVDQAQAQLEYWEGLMQLQESQATLMQELIDEAKGIGKNVKALKEKVDKLAEGSGGITGGIPTPFEGAADFEGAFDFGGLGEDGGPGLIDQKIALIKESLLGLKEAWLGAFTEMGNKITEVFSGLEGKWLAVKGWWDTYITPILESVGTGAEEVWAALKEEMQNLFALAEPDMKNFGDEAQRVIETVLEKLPEVIGSFSTFLAEDAIPAMGNFGEALISMNQDMREAGGTAAQAAGLFGPFVSANRLGAEAAEDLKESLKDLAKRGVDYIKGKVEDLSGSILEWYEGMVNSNTFIGTLIETLSRLGLFLLKVKEAHVLLIAVMTESVLYILGQFIPSVDNLEKAFALLKEGLEIFATWMSNVLKAVLDSIIDALDRGGINAEAWKSSVEDLQNAWESFKSFAENTLKPILEAINGWLETLTGWIQGVINGLKEIIDLYNQISGNTPPSPTSNPSSNPSSSGTTSVNGSIIDRLENLFDSIGQVGRRTASTTSDVSSRQTISAIPTVLSAQTGATIATSGGVVVRFGDVTINNDMDMSLFEARVERAVARAIS